MPSTGHSTSFTCWRRYNYCLSASQVIMIIASCRQRPVILEDYLSIIIKTFYYEKRYTDPAGRY